MNCSNIKSIRDIPCDENYKSQIETIKVVVSGHGMSAASILMGGRSFGRSAEVMSLIKPFMKDQKMIQAEAEIKVADLIAEAKRSAIQQKLYNEMEQKIYSEAKGEMLEKVSPGKFEAMKKYAQQLRIKYPKKKPKWIEEKVCRHFKVLLVDKPASLDYK